MRYHRPTLCICVFVIIVLQTYLNYFICTKLDTEEKAPLLRGLLVGFWLTWMVIVILYCVSTGVVMCMRLSWNECHKKTDNVNWFRFCTNVCYEIACCKLTLLTLVIMIPFAIVVIGSHFIIEYWEPYGRFFLMGFTSTLVITLFVCLFSRWKVHAFAGLVDQAHVVAGFADQNKHTYNQV